MDKLHAWRDMTDYTTMRHNVYLLCDCGADVVCWIGFQQQAQCHQCGATFSVRMQQGRVLVYRTPGPCAYCGHGYAAHGPDACLACPYPATPYEPMPCATYREYRRPVRH